jgi:hypothetical protein
MATHPLQPTKAKSTTYKNRKEKHTDHTVYVQGKTDQISRVLKTQDMLTILEPVNKTASHFRSQVVRQPQLRHQVCTRSSAHEAKHTLDKPVTGIPKHIRHTRLDSQRLAEAEHSTTETLHSTEFDTAEVTANTHDYCRYISGGAIGI